MAWYTDRRWMYEMTNSDGFANRVYCDNVDFFLDFAFSNEAVVDTRVTMNGETIRDIKCPCYKCQNVSYRDRDTVQRHLYKEGFMLHYTTWHEHGENPTPEVGESSTMEVDDDGYKQMVLDNMYSCGYTSNTLEGYVPNPEAKRFYDMLEAADEPLWEGKKATCSTKLKAATNFLTWKSLFNVSSAAYNYNISMVNALMPEENKLPKSFYDTKKSLENLSLPKERIDVCKNHCMIFYKHDKALTHCKHCKESRYKSDNNKVPNLVMTYMPIGPRLKRLYMSIKTAKDMTWHHGHKTKEGSMVHKGKLYGLSNVNDPLALITCTPSGSCSSSTFVPGGQETEIERLNGVVENLQKEKETMNERMASIEAILKLVPQNVQPTS